MKPIAWMSPDGKLSTTEGKLFYIPLYTAPRELSDEEIEKLATSKMNQILMDLLMPDVGNDRRIDWNMGCTKQHLINFARAILKKAGEK